MTPEKPFLIDIENFNKKLTEGIWANDGFELLDELIKPRPDRPSPKLEPVIPKLPDKKAMDKEF